MAAPKKNHHFDQEIGAVPTPGWAAPTDLEEFVLYIRNSGIDGRDDDARLRRFLTYPAAKYMPAELRQAIDLRLG